MKALAEIETKLKIVRDDICQDILTGKQGEIARDVWDSKVSISGPPEEPAVEDERVGREADGRKTIGAAAARYGPAAMRRSGRMREWWQISSRAGSEGAGEFMVNPALVRERKSWGEASRTKA